MNYYKLVISSRKVASYADEVCGTNDGRLSLVKKIDD